MFNNRFKSYRACKPFPTAPKNWTWESLMAEALKEADKAFSEGEVPVGAIIVDTSGYIISRAHNINIQSYNPCAHAEIVAIKRASLELSSLKLKNCILIVTLEPCLMCASAIAISCLKGLVFGAWDNVAGAIVSTNDFINLPINSRNIWYMGGISAKPCKQLLQNFFQKLRKEIT